jgi:hypothetical protein
MRKLEGYQIVTKPTKTAWWMKLCCTFSVGEGSELHRSPLVQRPNLLLPMGGPERWKSTPKSLPCFLVPEASRVPLMFPQGYPWAAVLPARPPHCSVPAAP